jgi:2-polyprenyl-6-methoxyphenol hydroxylase-like FAD-dependent oxidoreductase
MGSLNDDVLIVGGGIGGLALALELHAAGIPCRIYEAAPEIKAIGVGINILPHAQRVLSRLGLEAAMAAVAVETKEAAFYNRFGQHIYTEPLGRAAGYAWPQFSIHRADLQRLLVDAVIERLGADRLHLGWHATRVDSDATGATVRFADCDERPLDDQRGSIAIACDGVNSVVRKQLHPGEREPRYSGVTMWRGVTKMKPVLTGATFVRAGWLNPGKLVMYPIRNAIDAEGNQLMNWLAENETPQRVARDWTRKGYLNDFIAPFADWQWDWIDVPEMFRRAETILEYPMVDQDPLDRWTDGRVTLLGDAAHPMVPRGSNGAGQAILDAKVLTELLRAHTDWAEALVAYDAVRRPATANVVLTNRTNPPDAILRIVYERTGDRPFERIEDVVSRAELVAITDAYKKVAGYDPASLTSAAVPG